jgi:hypothetical protein
MQHYPIPRSEKCASPLMLQHDDDDGPEEPKYDERTDQKQHIE